MARFSADVDYYVILGVKPTASAQEIKDRFHYLCYAHHPDRFSTDEHRKAATEDIKLINGAFAILGKPDLRKEYDAFRQQSQANRDQKKQSSGPRDQKTSSNTSGNRKDYDDFGEKEPSSSGGNNQRRSEDFRQKESSTSKDAPKPSSQAESPENAYFRRSWCWLFAAICGFLSLSFSVAMVMGIKEGDGSLAFGAVVLNLIFISGTRYFYKKARI